MFQSHLITLCLLLTLCLAGPARVVAQHNHGAATHETGAMTTQDVLAEGVVISFSVMANSEHLKMLREMKMKENVEAGTTHNITVVLKDQKSQQPITDASVSMRLIDPSGKDQLKALTFEPSMNSYDAYVNMPVKGRYQILVLARYGDQKKTGGIYYDLH
ncbi:MAG: FixH family protein [Deltaproteobacteria bacterium]|nr:FixH family protein [Deltaproteobacteria bacterium]